MNKKPYWTNDDKLYLYKKCGESAGARICDSHALAEDVRSYAFEKALKTLDEIRPQPGTTKEQCLDCIAYTRVLNAIKHLNTKRVTMVTKATPITPTDYIPDEDDPDAKSEGIIVPAPASRLKAEWKDTYHNKRQTLWGVEKKIAVLLEQGYSHTAVRMRLKLSKVVYRRKIENLQLRFAQCFSGYKAHLAKTDRPESQS